MMAITRASLMPRVKIPVFTREHRAGNIYIYYYAKWQQDIVIQTQHSYTKIQK